MHCISWRGHGVKTGVLLMNTGTADEPTIPAVRAYLYEFLMDPAIIGAPEFVRKLIVKHIVRNRPQRTVKNYEAFWTPEGSPFVIGCYKQAEALENELSTRMSGEVDVAVAMRYGSPSVLDGLHELRVAGCERIVVLPSYPQQVNVCAGTCFKKVREVLGRLKDQYGWQPELVEVPYFYDQHAYRLALAKQVASCWRYDEGSRLVVSFHSTLLADIEAGDPYKEQTEMTAAALAADLRIPEEAVSVSYQSRFDNRKWLQPLTEPSVLAMAETGVKDVCVVCPGFTVDNMETVLEVSRDLRKMYMDAAGREANFTYVPALCDDKGLVEAMADAIDKAIAGKFEPEKASGGQSADTSVPRMLKHR